MNIRLLKKIAKARHSYGHSTAGIKIEMQELSHIVKKRDVRFWTCHWHKKQKYLRKHPDLMENGLGLIIKKKDFEEYWRKRKEV